MARTLQAMLLAALLLAVSIGLVTASLAQSSVADDLTQVRQQIISTEQELAQYSGGLVKALIQARLETLRLSEAMLAQKELAEKSGATFSYTLAAVPPDEKKAAELLGDIAEAEKELAHLETEAARYSGGLVGAMAQSNVATQRQSIAMLKQAYYMGHYGLYQPTSTPATTGPDLKSSSETGAATSDTATPAEPSYVAVLRKEGAEIAGAWAITRDKSEIDDSPRIRAFVGLPDTSPSYGKFVLFEIGCEDGQPRALLLPDTYLLDDDGEIAATYRLDDLTAINDRWSTSTNNKAAGYWGKEALKFAENLKGHERLVVQVTERNGDSHRFVFSIDGADQALDAVGLECGWSGFGATAEQMRQAQKLLKDQGFYAGKVDGQWGEGSRSALIEFQKSKGLPPTGLLDKVTRTALGV